MAIGFIPRDQDDEENDAIKEELHTLKEMWDARQLAEALVADQMLKDAHEVLFQQVRRYADQLEILDPETHNAAQEVSKVVLVLSYAETAQERLNALTNEAGRLMLAVAEARRQRAKDAKLLTKLRHVAPYVQGFFHALVWGVCVLLIALIAEGLGPRAAFGSSGTSPPSAKDAPPLTLPTVSIPFIAQRRFGDADDRPHPTTPP